MAETEASRGLGRTLEGGAKWALVIPILALVYGLDQWVKQLVVTTMEVGQALEVIPGLLSWRFYLNSGAAFSLGQGSTWIFTLISSVAALVVASLIWRAKSLPWLLVLPLLLAGIVGNLHDRLFRPPAFGLGYVVDYISVGSFAIFNIADAAICVSMGLIVLLTFLGLGLDGSREEARPEKNKTEGE